MKINEFNQSKKIDESLAGAMFGDVPMSALKGMFTGKGGKHQLAQDIFLRDFYQDAITSLDNGVTSGYVDKNKPYGNATDPNAKFGNATPQNVGPATAGAAGVAGTSVTPTNTTNALNAPTLAQPGTNVTTKAGTTGTTGSITTGGPGAPATPKPGAPTTPKPGTVTTTPAGASSPARPPIFTGPPASKPGTPAAAAPAAAAQKPTGIRGSFTQQGAAPTAAPLKPTSTNVKFNMPNAPQNPNNQQYKWAPKGMKIDPNTKLSSLGATGKLAESTYYNLNRVFESVVSEMNGEGAETVSITDHMLEWFGQYMDGANWESKKAAIIPQIKKIQDTYSSDKGKAAIKNLARLAYSITGQRGGGMPAGAKNAVQNTTGAQPSAANNLTPEELAAALAAQPPEVQQKVILQVQRMNVK